MSCTFRILVTGSRAWPAGRAQVVVRLLAGQVAKAAALGLAAVVVHGACPSGADAIAASWAAQNGVACEAWPADWGRLGRAAGPIRNQAMVEAGADVCLAFPAAGSRGTTDCVRRASAAGIPLIVTTLEETFSHGA